MGWKFRKDEITLKEFYNLSQQDRDVYIQNIVALKIEERSSMDEILLNQYSKNFNKSNNFFSLENLD